MQFDLNYMSKKILHPLFARDIMGLSHCPNSDKVKIVKRVIA